MSKGIKFGLIGLIAVTFLFGIFIPGVRGWMHNTNVQKNVNVFASASQDYTGSYNLNKDGKVVTTGTVLEANTYKTVQAADHFETISARQHQKRLIKHYRLVADKYKADMNDSSKTEAERLTARGFYNSAEQNHTNAKHAYKVINRGLFANFLSLFYNGTAPYTTIAYLGIAFVIFYKTEKKEAKAE